MGWADHCEIQDIKTLQIIIDDFSILVNMEDAVLLLGQDDVCLRGGQLYLLYCAEWDWSFEQVTSLQQHLFDSSWIE